MGNIKNLRDAIIGVLGNINGVSEATHDFEIVRKNTSKTWILLQISSVNYSPQLCRERLATVAFSATGQIYDKEDADGAALNLADLIVDAIDDALTDGTLAGYCHHIEASNAASAYSIADGIGQCRVDFTAKYIET